MRPHPFVWVLLATFIFWIVVIVATVKVVFAHDAPSGWTYPLGCCSDYDCRQVDKSTVRETPEGFVIVATGEIIPMLDRKVRESPDGEYHWCSTAGSVTGKTICLFVPPRGY